MMDFTDMTAAELRVGASVRMAFRVKDHDDARRYVRYFWKATPALVGSEEA